MPPDAGPDRLRQAASDLGMLLARGYPRERVLTLVGDRWGLAAEDRHALRRAVHHLDQAARRKARLISLDQCNGQAVGVDGYNVLITLESALSGRRLVLADDGPVRDLAGLGRNHRSGIRTWQAARLMAGTLAQAGARSVKVWFDAPISNSGELAARVAGIISEAGLSGWARAVPVPKRELARHQGPAGASDSALIDAAALPLDLAGAIIRRLSPAPKLERFS